METRDSKASVRLILCRHSNPVQCTINPLLWVWLNAGLEGHVTVTNIFTEGMQKMNSCTTLERAALGGLGHQHPKEQSLSLWFGRDSQNSGFFLSFMMTPDIFLSSQRQRFVSFRAEECTCSLVPLATFFLVGHILQRGIFLWSIHLHSWHRVLFVCSH